MRVLLINDFKIGGGAEVVFLKTNEILKDLGHDVDVVYHDEKIKKASSILSYLFSFKEYKKMNRTLNEKRYDVIYILNYAYAYSPSILLAIKKYKKRYPKTKVIYNAHDFHIICPNSGFMYFEKNAVKCFSSAPKLGTYLTKKLDHRGHLYSWLKKMQWIFAYKILNLYEVFDTIVCPSAFLMNRINEFYPNKKVYLLRNPLEIKTKTPTNDLLISKPLKLIYFGRLSSEKGLNVLINEISKINDGYELHLYGDGPEKNNLCKTIERLGVQDKIKIKGKLVWNDLMEQLPSYDIFILPSIWYENAPLSIVEAAASGLYIMTMGYGGMKELAQIVGNYYFINPISSYSLGQAFEKIRNMKFEKVDLTPFSVSNFKSSLAKYL